MMRIARKLLVISVAAILAAVFALAWLLRDLPSVGELPARASKDSTKIYDRHGALLFEVLDPRAGRRTRMSLAELPDFVPAAVMAVEDSDFYSHPGVDARAVARVVWQYIRHGNASSGASTITQQLARQILLSPEERHARSIRRKFREMALALAITHRYDKDLILELYLNEVYFGQLAYGIEAASRTFFGKPARHLDLAEAALLAGLIQSPAR
jgi:membrane peptidoglycan carboxypeptidase